MSKIEDKISELETRGFCVLRAHFPKGMIEACRDAFRPFLLAYLREHGDEANRGSHRHFLAMPFERPIFAPEFFFDPVVLKIVHAVMDERAVADQWGCEVPVRGSGYQEPHPDYQRPLFAEAPDLSLPFYMLVVSFGLVRIGPAEGPIEIAAGTHRMPRKKAMQAVQSGEIGMEAVSLALGDVLIRHPWALHRGTPNMTEVPRALVTIRYVRSWYADGSRVVKAIPRAVWESLGEERQLLMRFPVGE